MPYMQPSTCRQRSCTSIDGRRDRQLICAQQRLRNNRLRSHGRLLGARRFDVRDAGRLHAVLRRGPRLQVPEDHSGQAQVPDARHKVGLAPAASLRTDGAPPTVLTPKTSSSGSLRDVPKSASAPKAQTNSRRIRSSLGWTGTRWRLARLCRRSSRSSRTMILSTRRERRGRLG
jgi:hypothetical protein